jgi:hypothetical protein
VATATANPNVTRWTPLVEKSAAKWHVPTALLLAQIDQESGGKLGEVSSAGAGGLTQFIPSTAAQYGVKYGNGKAEVESQLEGQARLMSNLLRSYGGNASKALEAYNAGKAGTGLAEPENYAKSILAKVSEYGGSGGTENVSLSPELEKHDPELYKQIKEMEEGKGGGIIAEGWEALKKGDEKFEKGEGGIPGVPSIPSIIPGASLVNDLEALFEPKSWVRIAEGLIGVILILSALKTLSGKYGASREIIGQTSEGAVYVRQGRKAVQKRATKKAAAKKAAKKAAEAAAE